MSNEATESPARTSAWASRRQSIEDFIDATTFAQPRFARAIRFVDYCFYAVYALLGARLLIAWSMPHSGAWYVKLIGALSAPLYFASREGKSVTPWGDSAALIMPIGLAIMAYVVLNLSLKGLLYASAARITKHRLISPSA